MSAPPATSTAWRASRAAVALILIALGVSAAQVGGERYPFSRFDMFSEPWVMAARIVVRDPLGRLDEVGVWGAWDCPQAVDFMAPGQCDNDFRHPEHAQKAADTINGRQQSLPDGMAVEVVRRIYSFPRPDGPPATDECVIARCTASQRSGDGP